MWFWIGGGVFCVVLGLVGKEFHFARLTGGKGPKVPAWVARTWFLAIAVFCFFMGIRSWLG
jgi:hypothetical protein